MLEERLRSILHQARQRFPILKTVHLRPPFLRPVHEAAAPRTEELRDLQKVWEAQAQSDPLWAILSEQDKRGRGWKLEEFFAAGEEQVAAWVERFAAAGMELRSGSAVDFGCGVGRLTQALAKRFDHVTGVDISPTMVELARRLNRHGTKARYILNSTEALAFIPSKSADLVLSFITLQHIRPDIATGYIKEFFRIAKPGAALFFQLPSHLRDEYARRDVPDVPLPADACTASLSIRPGALPTLRAGQPVHLEVSVRNASRVEWRQARSYPLNLANRWFDAAGALVVPDDGRERLPLTLPPNGEANLKLMVVVPRAPGRYTLLLDVVQEGIRWFQDAGSSPLRISLEVGVAPAPEAIPSAKGAELSTQMAVLDGLIQADYKPAPAFEMHGIPREEVFRIVRDNGGEVLASDEHNTEWASYSYYIRKRR